MLVSLSKKPVAVLALIGILAVAPTVAASATELDDAPGSYSDTPPYDTGVAGTPPVTLTAEQRADVNGILAATDTGSGTFSAADAVAAGASEQAAADAGAIYSAAGWVVTGGTVSPSESANVSAAQLAACSGFSGPHGWYFPWGSQFGLDSCQTSQLIASVGLGAAGAGAVTAILVATGAGAIAGGIVTAVIALGAAAFTACQAYSSNGAIWLNLGGSPAVSCWGQ